MYMSWCVHAYVLVHACVHAHELVHACICAGACMHMCWCMHTYVLVRVAKNPTHLDEIGHDPHLVRVHACGHDPHLCIHARVCTQLERVAITPC